MKSLSLLFLVALFSVCTALNCTAQYQCNVVSQNYNYVNCSAGQCVCLKAQGFDGDATLSNQCRCISPKNIYYLPGGPYCVDVAAAASYIAEKQREDLLKSKTIQVYNNLISPNAYLIAAELLSVDNLFVPTARGRVTPVGTFSGIVLRQYFFALAATTNIENVYFINLKAEGNTVSFRVDIENRPPNGFPRPHYNFTQTGFFYFDDSDRVIAADLTILNLGEAQNFPDVAVPGVAQSICANINGDPTLNQTQGRCNGANQQFSSFQDCMAFMTSVPKGSYDRTNSNSLVCRTIHNAMTIIPPQIHGADIHCSHVGISGGGMCVNFDYSTFYTNDVLNPFP